MGVIAGLHLRGTSWGDGQPPATVVQRMAQAAPRAEMAEGRPAPAVYADLGCALSAIPSCSLGASPDDSTHAVLDGFLELPLDRSSHASTPASLLARLYQAEGVEGLRHCHGAYAAALWDGRRRELLLVRDRLGLRSLHYALTPGGLAFGSSVVCLQAAGVTQGVDEDALRRYLRLGFVPEPFSAHAGVRRLPPGTWVRHGPHGEVRTGRHAAALEFSSKAPPSLSWQEGVRQVHDAIDAAVDAQAGQGPRTVFLQGGLGSGLLVASLAQHASEPVRTLTLSYGETSHASVESASLVARRYRTAHQEISMTGDLPELVSRVARHLDEPLADPLALATWCLCQGAQGLPGTVWTGDGGGELFAGDELVPLLDGWRRRLQARFAPNTLLPVVALRRLPGRRWTDALRPEWRLTADAAVGDGAGRRSANGDPISRALAWESGFALPNTRLSPLQAFAAAHGVEPRSPLLDHRVAELATRLPHDWKMRQGRGRFVLLTAVRDRLPHEVLRRSRATSRPPLARWLRSHLRTLLHDHLTSQWFLETGPVAPPALHALLREHDGGERDHAALLWALLMLALWRDHAEAHRRARPGAA